MPHHSMEELNTRSVLDTYVYPAQQAGTGSVIEVVSGHDQRIADIPRVLSSGISGTGTVRTVPFQPGASRTLMVFPNYEHCPRDSGDVCGVATIDQSLDFSNNQTLAAASEMHERNGPDRVRQLQEFLYYTSTQHLVEVADLRIFNPDTIYPGGGIKPPNATRSMAVAIAQDLLLAADGGKVRYCTALCDTYALSVLGRYGMPLHHLADAPVAGSEEMSGAVFPVWFDVEQLRDSLRIPHDVSTRDFRPDFDAMMSWQSHDRRPRDVERIDMPLGKRVEVQLGRLALEERALDERLAPYSPDFDDRHLRAKLREQYKGGKSHVLFRIDGKDPLADACRAVEARGFADELMEGNKFPDPKGVAAELHKNYARYDSQSTFLYLMDMESGEAMGVVRIIDGALKTLDDLYAHWGKTAKDAISAHGINTATSWDISSLVVEEGWRGSDAGFILNNALSKILKENPDVTSWTTVLVSRYYAMLTRFCGIPFERILGLQDEKHMGEPSVPAYLHTKNIAGHMKKVRPHEYQRLWLGNGLDYDTVELRR